MKKLLTLFIFIAISTTISAQTGSYKYNQITGSDLNEVTYKIDGFAGSKMRLTKNGEQSFEHLSDTEVVVTQEFQKFNAPDKTLTITYNTTPKEHRLYINSIIISGTRELFIEFYVKYWKTTIELEDGTDGLLASSRHIGDQVELYTGTDNRIEITAFK